VRQSGLARIHGLPGRGFTKVIFRPPLDRTAGRNGRRPQVAIIVLVALHRLCVGLVTAILFGAIDPLEHTVFQTVFGQIMTLLIALEFNHTLRYVVAKHQSFIQTKVVVLIALLALARKFIILDIRDMTPEYLLGLAAITLALGVTYWLVRDSGEL
jgi:uncharacterized membrane protein (DUF373 family)